MGAAYGPQDCTNDTSPGWAFAAGLKASPTANPIVITVTFPIPTVANRSSTIALCPEKSSKLVDRRCFGAESNICTISHAASPHPQGMGGDSAEALRQRPRTTLRGGTCLVGTQHCDCWRTHRTHTCRTCGRYPDDAADRLRVPTEVPGRAVSPGKRGQMGATSGFRALSWAF